MFDGASKQLLENEFGTSNEDECMKKILEGGMLQETEVGIMVFLYLCCIWGKGWKADSCVCY